MNIFVKYLSLAFSISSLLIACNKEDNATLKASPEGDIPQPSDNRVLFITVSGAVGTEVRDALPPVLTGLTDHSIYSWQALTDYQPDTITDKGALTNLLTGVTQAKHQVRGSILSGNLADYPVLFTRIKNTKPTARTVSLSSSAFVKDSLARDATVSSSFNNDDAATKNAVIAELKSNDPDLLFAEFNSTNIAGQNTSYSLSSPAYKAAILSIDAYIGEIIKAVEQRPAYKTENWLIIINSSKGSSTRYVPPSGPWSAYKDTRLNVFSFYYNTRFAAKATGEPVGILPYSGTTPSYLIGGSAATSPTRSVAQSSSALQFAATGVDYTIQCKVKIPAGAVNYPPFLGKRENFAQTFPGWVFFIEGTQWRTNFGRNLTTSASATGNKQLKGSDNICDNTWHTLTLVLKWEGAQRNGYSYTDGVMYPLAGQPTANDVNIAAWGTLVSQAPFTVGYIRTTESTPTKSGVMVTDVRIYNTALSAAYIAANYCQTDVPDSDPYKPNLIGFWPSTEVAQNSTGDRFLEDKSGFNNHLKVENFAGSTFSEIAGNVCPPPSPASYRVVPNSVDASILAYQWLGIAVPKTWNLDGSLWMPNYVDVTN